MIDGSIKLSYNVFRIFNYLLKLVGIFYFNKIAFINNFQGTLCFAEHALENADTYMLFIDNYLAIEKAA